jgi:hypothetical protein
MIGDYQAGLEWADRALAAARGLGLDATVSDLLVTRGTARFRLGDEEAGLEDLRRAIADAETGGWLITELRARNNLAWLLSGDDPRASIETAQQGFEIARDRGVMDLAITLADVACATALDTGDWDWALETVAELDQRGVSGAFRIDLASLTAIVRALRGYPQPLAVIDALTEDPAEIHPHVLAGVAQARAWAAFVAGAFAEARELATRAAAGSVGTERADKWQLAARSSLWLGDRDAMAADLAAWREVGLHGRAADAVEATLGAGLAALDGDDNAPSRYRAAIAVWRGLDLPMPLAVCLLEADRFTDAGEGDLAEAVGILRGLGANGLLRLAESVSPPAALARPARSRRPSASTARRSGAARHRPPATDRPRPPG